MFGNFLKIVGGLVVFFFALAIIGAFMGGVRSGVHRAQTGVTYEQFQRVQTGISLAQVQSILGVYSTETPKNRIDGGGFIPTIETASYDWEGNRPLSRVGVIFQNDKVFQKTQFGLK